jgi:hypothetical protein
MSGKTARHIRSFPPEAERAAARALQLHLSTERFSFEQTHDRILRARRGAT